MEFTFVISQKMAREVIFSFFVTLQLVQPVSLEPYEALLVSIDKQLIYYAVPKFHSLA